MSKKHYEAVAAAIREQRRMEHSTEETRAVNDALRKVAGNLAAMFRLDNSRFDPSRFMEAAGFGEGR